MYILPPSDIFFTSEGVQEKEINSGFGWYNFSRTICLFTIFIDVVNNYEIVQACRGVCGGGVGGVGSDSDGTGACEDATIN